MASLDRVGARGHPAMIPRWAYATGEVTSSEMMIRPLT